MAKSVTGIYISRKEIDIACSDGKTYYETLPTGLLDENGIASAELLARFLKDTKNKYGFDGKNCTLVLPEGITFFRTVDSPVVSDEQVLLNLPFEFNDYVGENANAYEYDYAVESVENDADGKPSVLHLLAAAGEKTKIDEFAKTFRKAGMNMVCALPNEMSICNLFKEKTGSDKEYCLVDLEYNFTNVYIFKGSSIRASKTIEHGIVDIDKAIASELDVNMDTAFRYGKENYQNILSNANILPVYEKIALEVMKTLNFYRYEFVDSELNTIHFFSMGSENEELCNIILRQLGFRKGDLSELLPSEFKKSENKARCLMAIGAIL